MANELRFGSDHAGILQNMRSPPANQSEILVKSAIFSGNSQLVSQVYKLSKQWNKATFFSRIHNVKLYLKCLDQVLHGHSKLFWSVILDSSSAPHHEHDILMKVLETFEAEQFSGNCVPSLGAWNESKDKQMTMIKLLWEGSLLREDGPFLLAKNLKTLKKILSILSHSTIKISDSVPITTRITSLSVLKEKFEYKHCNAN